MIEFRSLLDAYPDLSPEDRARVDESIADYPEHAGAYADARKLAVLLDDARRPADALDQAQSVVDRRFRGEPKGLIDADLAARFQELDAEATDPIQQFERLAGRSFDGRLTLPASGGDSAPEPLALVNLSAARAPRRLVWLPRLAAAAAVVIVAYGALFGVSVASVSERAQVASLADIKPISAPILRGESATSASDRVLVAMGDVQHARHSTFGLFPRYDADALGAAAAALAAIAEEAPSSSWVSQEARLARGRVLIYLERDVEAARVLGTLIEDGSYQGGAARRMLDYLRSQ